ncbi:MAG: prepilin peptidase, partial [Candidatus Aenigmatarchaeota archaeon]
MITIAIVYYLFLSISQNNFSYIMNSVIVGLIFLGFGFLMYYLGQWGGGDAKLLSAIGFLLPVKPEFSVQTFLPFPLTFFINLFFVGAAYMLIYAFIYSISNQKIFFYFIKDIKASGKFLSITLAFFLIFIIFFSSFNSIKMLGFLSFSFVTQITLVFLLFSILLFLIWKFARTVEKHGFVKRIPISKLKVGDVLANSRYIEGITAEELKKIKKSGRKFVKIKEGVRFGLAFPLALLTTIYFGDILFLFRLFL